MVANLLLAYGLQLLTGRHVRPVLCRSADPPNLQLPLQVSGINAPTSVRTVCEMSSAIIFDICERYWTVRASVLVNTTCDYDGRSVPWWIFLAYLNTRLEPVHLEISQSWFDFRNEEFEKG